LVAHEWCAVILNALTTIEAEHGVRILFAYERACAKPID